MMHWYGGGMGWWGAVGVVLLVALFWALVLGSVVVLVRYLVDGHNSARRAARYPPLLLTYWPRVSPEAR